MPEERKVVTVLFADCVGSTGIGEQLDPEELSVVMRAFFDEMRHAVEAEGGVVEKFVGDAVMALFGVPFSHEDDPSRALRCALSMQARMAGLNARIEPAHGVCLALRIGVNTGELLVSDDPDADLGTVTGDAVNVAARLEQQAEPGEVVVAERTARSAREFRFEEIGPVTLKGKSTPVFMYRVVSRGSGTLDDERGAASLTAPMVGRERELSLLQAIVDHSASEGRPHLVTVYGEAGVGKSRLVRELVGWAESGPEPALVIRGRCLPYGDGVTYWPIIEILKGLAGVLESDPPDIALRKLEDLGRALLVDESPSDAAQVVDALAAMAGVLDERSPLRALAPRELRLEMHAAWRTVLSRLASTQPVLAIVEDIHWGDAALLDLLEDLAERTVGPLILVCPSRPDLIANRPGWGGGRRNASSIALEPLSLEDASRLTSLLLDVDDMAPEVRQRILQRAEGNPFFLEEILRQLIDEGLIVREGGRWRALTGARVEIPDSVQSVLAARIDLLPADSKTVLQRAAVVGRVFWTGALGDRDGEQLEQALDLLEGRDLISTALRSAFRGQRECIFRHVLICDVAYESIPRRDRAELHAQVATWLDGMSVDRDGEFAELLAHHWSEAHRGAALAHGESEVEMERRRVRALSWCLHAAKEASRRAAVDRSRTYAERALTLAVAPDEVADAAAALGEAHSLIGNGSPALDAFRRAADALFESGHDPLRTAWLCARVAELVARWPGSLIDDYDLGEIRSYLERGLAIAGDADSEARARLLNARSMWDWGMPTAKVPVTTDPADRESDATEAAAIAMRLDLPDVESCALDGLLGVAADERRFRRMRALTDRRLELVPRLHDLLERGDALCMAGWARFEQGEYAEVVGLASQVIDQADVVHWSSFLHALWWRSAGNLLLGEWNSVLLDFDAGSSALTRYGIEQPPPFACGTWALAAFIHAARGRKELSEQILESLPAAAGEKGAAPSAGNSVGLALARLGRFGAAARRLGSWPQGVVAGEIVGSLASIDIGTATGDWDGVDSVISQRLATPDAEGPPTPCLACAAEVRGRRALDVGDTRAAQVGLSEARGLWSGLGAAWPVARVELALAVAGQQVGSPDARMFADHALDFFERVGALEEARQARGVLGSA